MARSKPVPMLCLYRVKPGKEAAFRDLLAAHWPALRAAGLATAARPVVARSVDRKGRTCFVERFSWADGGAAERAHGMPEVLAVWGPMGDLAAEMEFLDLAPERLPARGPRRRVTPSGRRTPSRGTRPRGR